MNAKEYLKQYQEALVDIRNLEAEVEELENMAMSVTVNSDGERVQSSGSQDPMGNLVAKICDMKIELMDKRSSALDKLREIEKVIKKVKNPVYKELLHLRYIQRFRWQQISVELGKEIRYTQRLHGRALKEVSEYLSKSDM